MSGLTRRALLSALLPVLVVLAALPAFGQCDPNDPHADVVALNQPFVLNRLGAMVPQGMIYALKRDVVPDTCYNGGGDCTASGAPSFTLQPGKVQLRRDRRPRPLVLRVNEGQCLIIQLWNMLPPAPPTATGDPDALIPFTRQVSIHVNGLELATGPNGSASTGIANDGSFVGRNATSLVDPGNSAIYRLLAAHEGTYLMYSMGANFDQATTGGTFMGTATNGMFGAVNVQPKGAEYYRSQITHDDLINFATKKDGSGNPTFTPDGQPKVDYQARYPAGHPRACAPVLRMVAPPQKVSGSQCVAVAGAAPDTFYGDLTAIITGPNTGDFTGNGPSFDPISASPDRRQPYREFTIHYHELNGPTQAFNAFAGNATCKNGPNENGGMENVLTPGSDLFAINYGTGGIAAEILANRYKVGPEKDCVDCRFEEFFLSAWAVGDPAEVTDVLANQTLNCPFPDNPNSPPATKVLFPDDPSNVYHSYLNDHVKFRVLHAGATLTHVHHQHAHQWLHSPNDNDSTYLDSQMISPGSAYTLEIDYHGSGNRNRTVGDSIFHCHFYPHFAAGMWSMWRVHDVFEGGTELQPNGVPKAKSRATPDGEIVRGAPIPAIVPVPTLVMPPLPSYATLTSNGREAQFGGTCLGNAVDGMPIVNGTCVDTTHVDGKALLNGKFFKTATAENPGYPFFVPGIGGSRPPHPPLDYACDEVSNGVCKTEPITQDCRVQGEPVLLDGGLPRHVVVAGSVSHEHHNVWDFTKDNDKLDATQLPEDGTPIEKAAIAFNAMLNHPSFTPDGTAGMFRTNGLPRGPQHGAPFADPAVHMDGTKAGSRVVRYKAANVQTDVVFNKSGWHYPQQRFITLWGDVKKTLDNSGDNLPQPFFFRANSKTDIIEYWLANLVPAYYELDDFQVRTPTDILGQHIHLVKFDVLASDGAANGFNYEDGTLSYQEVDERIKAINAVGGLKKFNSPNRCTLTAKGIPELPGFIGAQATIQRWYPDPLLGDRGHPNKDRTLRTVFTHDHFGPSTHQQAGLYAGLLVEPEGSTWTLPDGTAMGTRSDGGPTSWEARIVNGDDSYREFALEFQDLALAYGPKSISKRVCYPDDPAPVDCTPYGAPYPSSIGPTTKVFGWADPGTATPADQANVINPSNPNLRQTVKPTSNRTNPTIITGSVFTGTLNVNYRNEPLALRVDNGPATTHNPNDQQTDLAFGFASINRALAELNTQPALGTPIDSANPSGFKFSSPFAGAGPLDPYTPLLRAYQGDKVQVRVLVGGYLFNHNFAFHGVKWLFEPSALDSGYRDNQPMGISEHFEFLFKAPVTQQAASTQPCVKGAGAKLFCADYLYTPGAGQWDLAQGLWGLMRTYNTGGGDKVAGLETLPNNKDGGSGLSAVGCPAGAPKRQYYVKAVNDGQLSYNARISVGNQIVNPYALRFVLTDQNFKALSSEKIPLVLRADAGDCVSVTLKNAFSVTTLNDPTQIVPPFTMKDQNIPGFMPFTLNGKPLISGFYPSAQAGLHPQLLSYDVTKNGGMNVGINPNQTVAPGQTRTYTWFAGTDGGTAVELGSANIIPADPIEHPSFSMVGAFVTEPKGSSWPSDGRLFTDVKSGQTTLFKEFVNVLANNAYLYAFNAMPPANGAQFFNAINYWSNSMAYRYGGQNGVQPNFNPNNANTPNPNPGGLAKAFSNSLVVYDTASEQWGDPRPVWIVERKKPFRLRMVHTDGLGGFPDDVMKLHGHVWAEEPYTASSTQIGSNPKSNFTGGREGFGPGHQFDMVFGSAGGKMGIPGDYLLASFPAAEQANGNWALVRVCDPEQLQLFPCTASPKTGPLKPRDQGQKLYGVKDEPPSTTSPDRFFLRTKPALEEKPDKIHVPANTATPPPPASSGSSGGGSGN